MKKVLIVTNKSDIHADMVIEILNSSNQEFVRLNTEDFLKKFNFSYHIDGNLNLELSGENQELSVQDIKSVWYRKPKTPDIDNSITNTVHRNFISSESEEVLRGLYLLLGNSFWINPLPSLSISSNKLEQLFVAKKYRV